MSLISLCVPSLTEQLPLDPNLNLYDDLHESGDELGELEDRHEAETEAEERARARARAHTRALRKGKGVARVDPVRELDNYGDGDYEDYEDYEDLQRLALDDGIYYDQEDKPDYDDVEEDE